MLTQNNLDQFVGTENYYQYWSRQFVFTDGVKYLAQEGGAYWLLDAIASYQPQLLKDPMLQQFQDWKLTVNPDQKAQLICERDTDDVVVTQNIEFTDFPLTQIRLYLICGILMLVSEY